MSQVMLLKLSVLHVQTKMRKQFAFQDPLSENIVRSKASTSLCQVIH